MLNLTLAHQTMFADLVQRSQDATFDEQYPEGGSFVRHARSGREYWYYVPSIRVDPHRKHLYVGPCQDPEIEKRVAGFEALKVNYRERRVLVSSLRAVGLPHPDRITGDIVEALWKAGFFRLRGVLIGTVAFQTYAGLLGAKLAGASLMTGDVDIAQFHSISLLVDDTTPPMGDVLATVDPTFKPVPHVGSRALATAFANQKGYKVEFLTPNRGSDKNQGKPTKMPALGGMGAEPLRYLDFLIYHPVNSVLLHKGGVPVAVPAPERFAIHKLIVSSLRRLDRNGYTKANKDLMQAGLLIETMVADRRGDDVGTAWMEAWERGPNWQRHLIEGAQRLDPQPNNSLNLAIGVACLAEGKRPELYGILDVRVKDEAIRRRRG
jgi:hypothetical protein